MTSKDFYRTYQADDEISDLAQFLFVHIYEENPVHVFEFGMGTGKHLKFLSDAGIEACGIDISLLNVAKATFGHNLNNVSCGNENYLRHVCNYDLVFTISVMDHIEEIDQIIGEFKRIANKAIYLAETNDKMGEFYYPHHYEKYGFEKVEGFEYTGEDGAIYYIWKFKK